jgi:hypothetical protein
MNIVKIALLTNLITDFTDNNNVGDVFIRFGLQEVLKHALPEEEIEWILISRFSPLSKESKDLIAGCDYCVYAGMPQYNNLDDWKFYYDDELWDDLNNIGVPILRLAGGGGYPSDTFTPDEFAEHLYKSTLTKDILEKSLKFTKLITTRDKMAQAYLDKVGVKSTLLPCSGTFACNFRNIHKTDKTINAVCLNGDLGKRSDRNNIIAEIKKTIQFLTNKTGKPCLVFAQLKGDYEYLRKTFDNVIRVENSLDIMDYYKHIDYCITTRLHFGLPVHGIGAKVIMLRVDTRGIAAEELGIPVIPLSKYSHAKFLDIFENDKFSKIPPEKSFNKCVEFYKNFFKKENKK